MLNRWRFESSVNSYDSQTSILSDTAFAEFESSVNSYDSQTPQMEHHPVA